MAADFVIRGVVELQWDAGLPGIVVTWQGGATAAEFAALLDAEVKALAKRRASNLLVDCRLQRPLEAAAQDRADLEWAPRAVAAGLRRFAAVLPKDREAAVHLIDRLGRMGQDGMEIRFFQAVPAARAWLAPG